MKTTAHAARKIAILGATGSIGASTLDVVARHPERFTVSALAANRQWERMLEMIDRFRPVCAALLDPDAARELASAVRRESLPTRVLAGSEGLCETATLPEVDTVVAAIVGGAGLAPTLAAARAGKRILLANKETLVMAGELVTRAAREGGGEIVPVDSEHSAVLQCVAGRGPAELARLILTASGGPFRTWPRERIAAATVAEALRHPTWKMGKKITVDSATLVNKALEVIEAHFLFGLGYEAVEVVVHPQSVVHAFVEFVDGSVLAQVGFPTMELPILYALTYPERVPDSGVRRFDPVAAGALTFEELQLERFPAYAVGREAARRGGTAPAMFNAANEVAVQLFLDEKIPFGKISGVVGRVLERARPGDATTLAGVLAADAEARRLAQEAACS